MKCLTTILCLCVLSAVSALCAEVLVNQDFEDPTFPPAGWTQGGISVGVGSAGWSLGDDPDNQYAEGLATCLWESPPVFNWGKGWLNTPEFELAAGDWLIVEFDTRTTMQYLDPSIELKLCGTKVEWQTTNTLWKQNIWARFHYEIPISRTDLYYFQYLIDPRMVSYQINGRDIDNVLIFRKPAARNSAVLPSTVGRIKMVYNK